MSKPGPYFENQCRDVFRDDLGCYVVRAAGSRGAADLLVIDPRWDDPGAREGGRDRILFVQCKADGAISKVEFNRLVEVARHYGGRPVLAQRWGRGMLAFHECTGYIDTERRVPREEWPLKMIGVHMVPGKKK